MRRILVGLLILLLVFAGGVVYVMSTIDHYRPQIQSELQSKLGRAVTLGPLSLHLFPLDVGIDGLTIGEDPNFASSRPFATAKDVAVSVELFSLFGGSPTVESLRLSHPQIEIIRNAAGIWNFSTLGKKQANGGNSSFSLDELKIERGQVATTDLKENQPRVVYDNIDVTLSDFAPNKHFGLEVSAHLPGAGKELLSFKGKVGPLNPQNMAAVPVDGHVSLEEVSIEGANRFLEGSLPPNTDGIASADVDVNSEGAIVKAKGKIQLRQAIIRGAKLSYDTAATFDVNANRQSDTVELRSGDLKLGATSFAVSGTVDSHAKPAMLNLRVKTSNSSITELAQLAGSLGVAFNPEYKVSGDVSADLTAKGPATMPQLNGALQARRVQVSGGEIKEPVSIPSVSLALTPETVKADPFQLSSGSTTLQAAFTLSQYTSKQSTVDATLKTDGANIAELLNIAKAYGLSNTAGMSGTGKLSLNVQVQGPTSNPSKLTFAGAGSLADATITSPQLTKPVSVRAATLHFSQNSASIENLSAAIGTTAVQGNVSANNFAAPDVKFALTANTIDTDELQGLVAKGPAKPHGGQAAVSNGPSLLDKMTGAGTLAAGRVKAQELLLTNVHAAVKLDHGVVRLVPITSTIFGGNESGTIALDTRPAQPLCSAVVKLSGVDANAMLSAVSSVKNTLYGTLTAGADLSFVLTTGSELARTLNGTLSFNVAQGELKNVNMLNEISRVGKFLGTPAGASGANTQLTKLTGSFVLKSGDATTNNLVAAIPAGSFTGSGSLNLADQAINMHVTAALGSSASQTAGGTKAGGFLTTVLANNKGELVVPMIVTGTLAHPVFTPDAANLARMKLSSLVPTAADPSKLVGAFGKNGAGAAGALGALLGGDAAKPAAGQQQKDNPVNSLLQQFGKKKPK